ncbi:hypothetical protein ES704_02051 [subsurface metagenome]|jgi:hypothetical protein
MVMDIVGIDCSPKPPRGEDGGGLVGAVSIAKMHPVTFERVVAARVGDFDVTGLRVYAVHNNIEVTEVPAGASFEVHAEYTIRNYNPGLTWWTTCMSVYDVTHNRPVGHDSFGAHIGGGPLSAHDAANIVGGMPDEPTTFRVRIHANQKSHFGCPPESEW